MARRSPSEEGNAELRADTTGGEEDPPRDSTTAPSHHPDFPVSASEQTGSGSGSGPGSISLPQSSDDADQKRVAIRKSLAQKLRESFNSSSKTEQQPGSSTQDDQAGESRDTTLETTRAPQPKEKRFNYVPATEIDINVINNAAAVVDTLDGEGDVADAQEVESMDWNHQNGEYDENYDDDEEEDEYEWRVLAQQVKHPESGPMDSSNMQSAESPYYVCLETAHGNPVFASKSREGAMEWESDAADTFPEHRLFKVETYDAWSQNTKLLHAVDVLERCGKDATALDLNSAIDDADEDMDTDTERPREVAVPEVPICEFDHREMSQMGATIRSNRENEARVREEAGRIFAECESAITAVRCQCLGVAAEHLEHSSERLSGLFENSDLQMQPCRHTHVRDANVKYISARMFYGFVAEKRFYTRHEITRMLLGAAKTQSRCFSPEEYMHGAVHFVKDHLGAIAVVWAAEGKIENLLRAKRFAGQLLGILLQINVDDLSFRQLSGTMSSIESMIFELQVSKMGFSYPAISPKSSNGSGKNRENASEKLAHLDNLDKTFLRDIAAKRKGSSQQQLPSFDSEAQTQATGAPLSRSFSVAPEELSPRMKGCIYMVNGAPKLWDGLQWTQVPPQHECNRLVPVLANKKQKTIPWTLA